MTNEFKRLLNAVDKAMLTPLVRLAQQTEALEVSDWRYDPLVSGGGQMFAGVLGIYRFSGHARDLVRQQTVPWTLILKAFGGQSGTGSDDMTTHNYWKREVLAYQSDWLIDLPGRLTAPRCYGVTEYPDQVYWVWLEDLGTEIEALWPSERYGLVARHLGQFNGAYLTGRPMPAEPWLSRGRVQDWLDIAEPVMAELDKLKAEPIVGLVLGDDGLEWITRLWSEREPLLEALDKLPRCLCHHDAWRPNLMTRTGPDGQVETIALDWAIVGRGGVGEEIATLVGMSLVMGKFDPTDAQQVDTIIFAGYLAGLRDVGWSGDEGLVRYGYTATMTLFLSLGGFLMFMKRNSELDQDAQEAVIAQLTANAAQRAMVRRFLQDIGAEAQALRRTLF